jgi:hypothetical protein
MGRVDGVERTFVGNSGAGMTVQVRRHVRVQVRQVLQLPRLQVDATAADEGEAAPAVVLGLELQGALRAGVEQVAHGHGAHGFERWREQRLPRSGTIRLDGRRQA